MRIRYSMKALIAAIGVSAIVFGLIQQFFLGPIQRRAAVVSTLEKQHVRTSNQHIIPAQNKPVAQASSFSIPSTPNANNRNKDQQESLASSDVAPPIQPFQFAASPKSWNAIRQALTGRTSVEDVRSIVFWDSKESATDFDLRQIASILSVEQLDLTQVVCERTGAIMRSQNVGAPKVTDDGIANVATLPHLRFLNVGGSQITDRACESLQRSYSLETLGLERTAVTDKGLLCLAQARSLRTIDLRDTLITWQGVRKFQTARPDVQCCLSLPDPEPFAKSD